MLVDLRSDTVTKPTSAMRAAMAAAEVGDDVYGEDPTIGALEERVAGVFGREAAVFVPSGSMGNQICLRLLAAPGQEVFCDADAHVVTYELAAAAALSGIQTRTVEADRGLLDPGVVERQIRLPGYFAVPTAAVAVENTHNRGGGAVYPLPTLQEITRVARSSGVRVHCDGARIWNAHVATGVMLREYAALADTLSVCLSKGLGAPVGSLVVCDADRAEEARTLRKRMGGGWRQAGILAAAGLHALDHHVERLADDHRRARRLAELVGVDPAGVETNIVQFEAPDAHRLAAGCRAEGVLVSVLGPRRVRLLTHLDIDDTMVERAGAVVASHRAAVG